MNSALKKATSTPQLVRNTLESGQVTSKPNRQYLQDLESEVNKSRIAIENMSQARALDPNFYKKIQELQKQLHRCILAINQQTSKNKTLTDVITLLKGQMSEVQAVQRNQQEYQSNNFEKKIKKVEYDIKQILHKYNEEIAKINSLKQEANASRDERVVYSNLFNKIQKEIKHYEEIYKQTLIKNQMFLDKKKESQPTKPTESRDDVLQETGENFDKVPVSIKNFSSNKNVSEFKVRQTKSREAKKSIKITDNDMFLTNIQEVKPQIDTFKSFTETSYSKKDKNNYLNQNIENMIREKEGDINSILMTCQCKDIEDALDYYKEIYNINDTLYFQVDRLQSKIASAEEEIHRLNKQKRTSEVYQNGQISEFKNLSKNCRSNKNIIYEMKDLREDQCSKIILAIGEILHIAKGDEENLLSDDVLREIDSQIDTLCVSHFQRRGVRKQSKMIASEEANPNTDRAVSQLLEKIDKFSESEKIFDRNMLRMQYQKEMSKVRKKVKKSN